MSDCQQTHDRESSFCRRHRNVDLFVPIFHWYQRARAYISLHKTGNKLKSWRHWRMVHPATRNKNFNLESPRNKLETWTNVADGFAICETEALKCASMQTCKLWSSVCESKSILLRLVVADYTSLDVATKLKKYLYSPVNYPKMKPNTK